MYFQDISQERKLPKKTTYCTNSHVLDSPHCGKIRSQN